MKKKIIGSILLLMILTIPVSAIRTPTTTTIPPISAQSAGVIFQCSPFSPYPGSVVVGASGFMLIQCPSGGAVTFDGTLTPTLTLGVGYINASIILHGSTGQPCNFNFRTIGVGTITVPTGSLLNRTLTFSSNPVQGQMLTAVYDYCLQYFNAPSTGLGGFNIVWT